MPKIVDHELQRQALSSTVAEVVADLGIEATTLRTVASHHGCTKGMVQHYFADKEELLLAALEYVEDCCERRMSVSRGTEPGLGQLQARLSAQLPLDDSMREEWLVRLAFNVRAAVNEEMREALAARRAEHRREGMKCLRVAKKQGELRQDIDLSLSYRSLVALVFGIGVGAVTEPGQLNPATQRRMLQNAINDLRH